MKKLLVLILAVLLSGCATIAVENTTADEHCKVTYTSFFKSFEAGEMSACGAGGSAQNTDISAEAIQAILQAWPKP